MAPIPLDLFPITSYNPYGCRADAQKLRRQAERYNRSVKRIYEDVDSQSQSFACQNRALVEVVQRSSTFLMQQCSTLRDMQRHILGGYQGTERSEELSRIKWSATLDILNGFVPGIDHEDAFCLVTKGLTLSGHDLNTLPDGSALNVQSTDTDHALAIAHIVSLMAFSKITTDDSGYAPWPMIPPDGPDVGPRTYHPEGFIPAISSMQDSSESCLDRITSAPAEAQAHPDATEFWKDADLFSECVDSTADWFRSHCSHLLDLRAALYGPGADRPCSREKWLEWVENFKSGFLGGVTHAESGLVADKMFGLLTRDAAGDVTHATGSLRPDHTGHAMAMIIMGSGINALG